MFRFLIRLRLPAVLLAAAALSACGNPPDDSPEQQVAERLVGTWLRDYQDAGAHVRRVLVLQADGHFSENSVASQAGTPPARYAHGGEWRFDGTNLKRRYTNVNGKQPAAPMVPFATFEVRFRSPDEFVGIDHVHRREVVYQRVGEGTRP